MKKCGKCSKDLCLYKYEGIAFYLCKDCGAVLITKDDFKKLVEQFGAKAKVVDLFELNPITIKKEIRSCSLCETPMEQVYCEGVLIDRCVNCGLLLFDNGEISKYFSIFSNTPIEIMSNTAFIKKLCDNQLIVEEKGNVRQIKPRLTEKMVPSLNGWFAVFIAIIIAALGFLSLSLIVLSSFFILPMILCFGFALFMLSGLKIIKPQMAVIYTLFGNYYGTLKKEGFYWVLPFSTPHYETISLKVRTLENAKQKINDLSGNPIEVGIMVTWEVVDTAMAVFNVNDYMEFLSSQCDSALRTIVRLYPYDSADENVQSLKDDSEEIAQKLKARIHENVSQAGLNIIDARITHLAYSQEIAAAMLQRQQANAIIDARKAIVDGAVGMVEMAIEKLSKNDNINLDEKTKSSMVNNLLVILCGNKEAQPVINNDIMN